MKIQISSDEDIVESRTKCKELARKFGFGMVDQTKVATAVSELTRNVVDFAGEGTLTVESIKEGGRKGIEITSEDRGPGIEDLEKAMEEGYSTQRDKLGKGLPGVKKLMDEMEIESEPRDGTKIVVRKWSR